MFRAILAGVAASIAVPTTSDAALGEPPVPFVRPVAESFDPAEVRLLDGPFKQAQDADARYLLSIEPDRLLARFRKECGLAPNAEGYGGWEADTIGGHTLGHYLSACARMYAGTGDERFRERVGVIVAGLAECQAAQGDGYVAAIPGGRKVFEEVARGDIRTKGFDLNGLWVPWYTLHKEMAGLRDSFLYCRNARALEVMRGLGDFALRITDTLDAAQLNTMLRCEQGGMNEVAADLYALTGDRKYIELAKRFIDHQVIDPLADGRDILPGLHSNTQIPKVIGAARQHELWGDEKLASAAGFFWRTVTANHSYATGGNSLNEYLGPPRVLGSRLDGNTTETCNTYNMLKLTRTLHRWEGFAAYMDYYERALYNHILASQSPATGGVCYFLPLRAGSQKAFQGLYTDFTCCVGTGMENHASYGDAIYSHTNDALLVNLFMASTVRWKAADGEAARPEVLIRQETAFPDSGSTSLVVSPKTPAEFSIDIRIPAWLAGPLSTTVNGEPIWASREPGGYARIRRLWREADRVVVTLPMNVHAEPTPDDPSALALLAGPIVLAGDLGPSEPAPEAVPHIVSPIDNPAQWLQRVDGPSMVYRSKGSIQPADVSLVPLFRIQDQFYGVYWTRFTPKQWRDQEAKLHEREESRRTLEAITVDFVQPGEMQPERDHALEGDRTNNGEHRGLRWRDAYRGSWFSYAMKVPAEGRSRLICTYWGSDSGDREFDILVDNTKIATQTLDNNKPGEFFDVAYDIPPELTKGNTKVRVKFQAHPLKTAGGVFGCRIVRAP